jgi:hypothetical protein
MPSGCCLIEISFLVAVAFLWHRNLVGISSLSRWNLVTISLQSHRNLDVVVLPSAVRGSCPFSLCCLVTIWMLSMWVSSLTCLFIVVMFAIPLTHRSHLDGVSVVILSRYRCYLVAVWLMYCSVVSVSFSMFRLMARGYMLPSRYHFVAFSLTYGCCLGVFYVAVS